MIWLINLFSSRALKIRLQKQGEVRLLKNFFHHPAPDVYCKTTEDVTCWHSFVEHYQKRNIGTVNILYIVHRLFC